MNINQLNHIAIIVADLDRSVTFYRDVLELKLKARPDFQFPGAWFDLGGGQELHLIVADGNNLAEPSHGHMAFRVPDMDVVVEKLTAHGVHFADPKPRPDGPLQLFTYDPDGHIIEITDVD